MELGAVVAAAPIENVVRMKPVQGDLIVLLGAIQDVTVVVEPQGLQKAQNFGF